MDFYIRVFRKKCQKVGIVREGRRRKEFESAGKKRIRKHDESVTRNKRMKRKGMM